MIAVDRRYQNQGLGRVLLADALERAASVADQVGIKVVILDVIEDGGQEIAEKRYAFYTAMGFQPGDFPEAERYYREAISLPLYPTLEEAEQDRVVEALTELLP